MSAAIRGPALQDLREQTGRKFTVHHHRGNNHTQASLSAKDVLRAGGQRDKHVDGASIIQHAQAGREINVHISEANNVILNYYSQTVPPRCVQQLAALPFQLADWLLYGSLWLQAA